MKTIYKLPGKNILGILVAILLLSVSGCKNFVDVPLPVDGIAGDAAFSSDKSTSAVLNSVYGGLIGSGVIDNTVSVGLLTGFYTDETTNRGISPTFAAFYTDVVSPNNTTTHWSTYYKYIYTTNITIEAMRASGIPRRNQWLGEALFLRAYMYFYLVNMFGDVPLAITSDYKANNTLTRRPPAEVYAQIITDLLEAQSLLTDEYKDNIGNTTTVKGRPNKLAATALLARAYLYNGEWANAEAQATTIINNTTIKLGTLEQTFLAASTETLWALVPTSPNYVRDFFIYNNNVPTSVPPTFNPITANGSNSSMAPSLYNAFEGGDNRFNVWVRTTTTTGTPAVSYYYATKYKSGVNGVEFIVVLRKAEQYLIRAEARARLNNLNGAKEDIDAIRTRAGLGGVTITTQAAMLNDILHERQVELFTEGHRLYDLRRTGKLDEVMTAVAPQKNATWASFKKWWPIPSNDLLSNPNLTQTPGY